MTLARRQWFDSTTLPNSAGSLFQCGPEVEERGAGLGDAAGVLDRRSRARAGPGRRTPWRCGGRRAGRWRLRAACAGNTRSQSGPDSVFTPVRRRFSSIAAMRSDSLSRTLPMPVTVTGEVASGAIAASVMKVSGMSAMSTVRPASAAGPATRTPSGSSSTVQPMHSSTSRKATSPCRASRAVQAEDLDAAGRRPRRRRSTTPSRRRARRRTRARRSAPGATTKRSSPASSGARAELLHHAQGHGDVGAADEAVDAQVQRRAAERRRHEQRRDELARGVAGEPQGAPGEAAGQQRERQAGGVGGSVRAPCARSASSSRPSGRRRSCGAASKR